MILVSRVIKDPVHKLRTNPNTSFLFLNALFLFEFTTDEFPDAIFVDLLTEGASCLGTILSVLF